MAVERSYTDHVRAHEKSVVLGGAKVLFPVAESLTNGFAAQIRLLVREAENAAYQQGYKDAQRAVCKALGVWK